jgi:hypothetical protein
MSTNEPAAVKSHLAEIERHYSGLCAAWPARVEAVRLAHLDLIGTHAALSEIGRSIHQHALNDDDRARAKLIFAAAERMAAVRPRQLFDVNAPSPKDETIATALWRQRFDQALKARAASS